MTARPTRWAVLGAGYAGLAAAAALRAGGLDVDLLDRREAVGGLWLDGVYDSVRLVSTRTTTAYDDAPFPADPTGADDPFPTGAEMLGYLTGFARDHGLLAAFRGGVDVDAVTPGERDWRVAGRDYAGVVLCTGLHGEAVVPDLPGTFTGRALHTAHYRRPADLGPGGATVLVVGGGNSGLDVAVEAAGAGHRALLSVRDGAHLLPRVLFGRPVSGLTPPPLLPQRVTRTAFAAAVRVLLPPPSALGLPDPDHALLAPASPAPVLHHTIRPAITSGRVRVRPPVVALDGAHVVFADGSRERVDTVVWATGYRLRLPVERSLLDAADGPPALVAGVVSPVSAGLLALGLRVPLGQGGALLSAGAALAASVARLEAETGAGVGPLLARFVPVDRYGVVSPRAALRATRRAAAALPAVRRLLTRGADPVAAAGDRAS